MAERLEETDVKKAQGHYPWDEWTDGSIWRVRKGEDYDAYSLRTYLYSKAQELDMNVWTKADNDDQGESIIFQFATKTQTEESA